MLLRPVDKRIVFLLEESFVPLRTNVVLCVFLTVFFLSKSSILGFVGVFIFVL